ncbi:MAG TPA: hypothetical protein VF541_04425 [Longimicrobium sp.]|jgi:hypothetical protein
MLIIRDEQLRAMQAGFDDEFVGRILPPLRERHPAEYAALGPERLRALAHAGLERGGGYGLTSEVNVFRFVELMLLFGADFDTDPALPWAAAVLGDPELHDPDERMELLLDEARDELARASQPRGRR